MQVDFLRPPCKCFREKLQCNSIMQKRFSILKQKTAGFLILCCYDDSVKSGIAKGLIKQSYQNKI